MSRRTARSGPATARAAKTRQAMTGAAKTRAAKTRAAKTRAAKTGTAVAAPVSSRSADEIARTAAGPRALPALGRTRTGRAPSTATVTTDGGLAVTAVRRASSPMVELRLRIPFGARRAGHAARAELLAETILTGTSHRSRTDIDAELALVGGHLSCQVNPQRLLLSGTVLAGGLPVLLDVLSDVVTSAAYAKSDVDRERDRLVEHLVIAAAQPGTIARQYLQHQRFGDHPASHEMPTPTQVADVTAAAVRGLHQRAVLPDGSSLTLVGELRPARAVEAAAEALSGWVGERPARVLATPPDVTGSVIAAFHRAGAVQSQTRLSAAGVLRSDPGYPAAQLANIVFGGYFSSRLVENLREDKGFTYHAFSTLEFWPGSSAVTIGYDTATEVTAAALHEARYELGRIAVASMTDTEVDAARHYAIGSLAGSLASQAGYASMLSSLAGSGLDGEWLRQHPKNLAATTTEDVAAAAQRLFSPSGVTGIVLGDMETIGDGLARLGGVQPA